jgi:ribonuclease P protein component
LLFNLKFSRADDIKLIISVSKKVSKKAVVRNKIKRRVRATMREKIKNLKPGKYLIIAKPGSQNLKGKELENELRSVMMVQQVHHK